MSTLVFGNLVDLKNIVATPSYGYVIGYDTDKILKQKSWTGSITPIDTFGISVGPGGNIIGLSQSLDQILAYGNSSLTYSIMLGTSSYIGSDMGNGKIYTAYGNTNSTFLINTDLLTSTSSINLTPDFISINKTYNDQFVNLNLNSLTYSINIGSLTSSSIYTQNRGYFEILFREDVLGSGSDVKVISSGVLENSFDFNKAFLHLNTFGSTTSNDISNSVIIGGQYLLATESNTVYLGNKVNINNEYNLPLIDGAIDQVITTDGDGNLTWSTISTIINNNNTTTIYQNLSQVLAIGPTSGSYSIYLGTSQSISTENGKGYLSLDYLGQSGNVFLISDISSPTSSSILLTNTASYITSTSSYITTHDRKGLQYTDDYISTFTDNSLITKKYVDIISGFYEAYNVSYLDSEFGDDTTGIINRVDRPFKTYSKAYDIITTAVTDNRLIYIKKGVYLEAMPLIDGDIYCEPGVLFRENGFNDNTGPVNCNIYGYAKFLGNDNEFNTLYIVNNSNINFEFDEVIAGSTVRSPFIIRNTFGDINIKGRSIVSENKAFEISGTGSVIVNIDSNISSSWNTLDIGFNTNNSDSYFNGEVTINCKKVICNTSLNTDPNVISSDFLNIAHALNVRDNVFGKITINADLHNTSIYSGGNNSAAIITSGNVTINGNLYGNDEYGLYLNNSSNNTPGKVVINGDIESNIQTIEHRNNNLKLKVNNSFIRTNSLSSSYSVHLNCGASSSTYLYNTNIYNGLTNSTLIYSENSNTTLRIYNSFGYSPGTQSGYFINSTTPFNVGIHNTRSNKDNLNINDIFTPSGYIYDQNLDIPNF